MVEIDGLISTLKQTLAQTKAALSALEARRAALQQSPENVAVERQRIDVEIETLRSSVRETERVISSLSARISTVGFDRFGLAAEERGEI